MQEEALAQYAFDFEETVSQIGAATDRFESLAHEEEVSAMARVSAAVAGDAEYQDAEVLLLGVGRQERHAAIEVRELQLLLMLRLNRPLSVNLRLLLRLKLRWQA